MLGGVSTGHLHTDFFFLSTTGMQFWNVCLLLYPKVGSIRDNHSVTSFHVRLPWAGGSCWGTGAYTLWGQLFSPSSFEKNTLANSVQKCYITPFSPWIPISIPLPPQDLITLAIHVPALLDFNDCHTVFLWTKIPIWLISYDHNPWSVISSA